MTEFEQQVAAALRPLFSDGTRNYMDDCPLIAPRVAAAIQAAAHLDAADDVFVAERHEAALAALRGEVR